MNDIAIRIDNISKKYHIGGSVGRYRTIRETLMDSMTSAFRRSAKLLRGHATGAADLNETIWALRDVSFEVKRGEIVGIIGRNGAGKSTLLKILSRITEPTTGCLDIYGRLSALLEVSTGFHPELTGRENLYLKSAILGMKRREIDAKFDEIVAFSEVEKFIDTPIKHYSSGMAMRLGFAVSAHLEPEILVVDEVLAVGDSRFRRKCLNKMQDASQQGRTVLVVSHNMPAITNLCDRAILLDEGRVIEDGPSPAVVSAYLNSASGTMAARTWPKAEAPGTEVARLLAVRVKTEDGEIADTADIRQPVGIEMEYEVLQSGHPLLPSYWVYNEQGVQVFSLVDQSLDWQRRPRPAGYYVSTAWIPANLLAPGTFFIGAGIKEGLSMVRLFQVRDVIAFQAIDGLDVDSAYSSWIGKLQGGVVRPLLKWSTQYSANGNYDAREMATGETKR